MEFTVQTAIPEEDLRDRYGQRLFRYLLRLTGKRETAEDLTRETLLQAGSESGISVADLIRVAESLR